MLPTGHFYYLRKRVTRMLTQQPSIASCFAAFGDSISRRTPLRENDGQRKNKLKGLLAIVAIENHVTSEDRLFSRSCLVFIGPFCE